MYDGLDAGSNYATVGAVGLGFAGCVGGSFFPVVGTIAGCGVGWAAGNILGFGLGFFYGWTGSGKADNFDGVPPVIIKPF